VLSSTPGNAKPIFRTVSKLVVLLGMGECDYPQEQEPFSRRERAKRWRYLSGVKNVNGLITILIFG
jgi:hypothetical protein